ncbi:FHA domain-containing protein [Streptomyces sp. NPDC049099]|uniref:ABC transporter ATP-binding protein/permease n=1 Tax=Streptomyces sp. NPDC049099 TaxID=3155768 RepID=UPI003439C6CF
MGGPEAPSAPELVLKTATGPMVMSPSRRYRVGRDPACEITIDDTRVSWHHAVLRADDDHWTLVDAGSKNGTYVEGRRVRACSVGPGSVLHFGSPTTGPCAVVTDRDEESPAGDRIEGPTAVVEPSTTGTFRTPTTVRPRPRRTVRIGRERDNDLVIDDDLSVSRHHAELRANTDGTYEIVDLGSHNGTFLNGRPVGRALIADGDIAGIGRRAFCLIGDQLREYLDSGEVSLHVQDLMVAVDDGRTLLISGVSFSVDAKCLLAVVGPSGAGKSTLLNALTGLRPADHGTVLYDGRDLYRDYAELRQRIGLVPQDDILHAQLPVRRALRYAAELRFPQDTAPAEREARVDEVIRELGLRERAEQPIHCLSGGQRKRVSVALELLTKPSLIFLDEPTAGLDPGMERSVMSMLRSLADDGRTIIVATHSVLSLNVCDRLLVLAPGGRTAYYGPPADALDFFGFSDWPEAFEAFETDRGRDWSGEFQRSPQHRQYIEAVGARQPARQAPADLRGPPRRQTWTAQLRTLVRRYAAVLRADRTFVAIMIALPFVMGLLTRYLSGGHRLTPASATRTLLVLCVGAVLTGAANAVRELVKERAVYRRERAVGLCRSAYVMSKVGVLGTITVLQAVVLTVVALYGIDLNAPHGHGVFMAPLWEITLAVALLAFSAMMLGLLVSALVNKEEVTMPLLVLLAVVQVVFCGALVQVHGVLGIVAWLVPSRWALAAMASTLDLARIDPTAASPLFHHTAGAWLRSTGILVVFSAVLGYAVTRLLRRHEPTIMRK